MKYCMYYENSIYCFCGLQDAPCKLIFPFFLSQCVIHENGKNVFNLYVYTCTYVQHEKSIKRKICCTRIESEWYCGKVVDGFFTNLIKFYVPEWYDSIWFDLFLPFCHLLRYHLFNSRSYADITISNFY